MKTALDVGQTDADNRVVKEAQKENRAKSGQGDSLTMRAQSALLDLQAGNGAAGHGIGVGHTGPGPAIGYGHDRRRQQLGSAFTMPVCTEIDHPIATDAPAVWTSTSPHPASTSSGSYPWERGR